MCGGSGGTAGSGLGCTALGRGRALAELPITVVHLQRPLGAALASPEPSAGLPTFQLT